MRKFNHEVIRKNGKYYSNELRQNVANRVDYYINNSNMSAWDIWHKVADEYDVSWGSARRYHNALGNSPRARQNRFKTNIKPIMEQQYPEFLRNATMKASMGSSVPKIADKLNIANSTLYDWIKAYGWSTSYFNR